MSTFQLIFIIISINSLVPSTIARYGESCVSSEDGEGKCVPLKSCASAFELLKYIYIHGEENCQNEVSLLQQSKCDSDDETPLICCSKSNIRLNPETYSHLKNLNCGSTGSSSRVSKGQEAGLFDFRWMALLKYNGRKRFACGGSLIDNRHILTAAHCLHNFENLPIAVRLGEYDILSDPDCLKHGKRMKCLDPVQDIGIEEYIIHEDYIYKGIYDDLAILRLERPVNFTKSIRPICLPISKELQSNKPDEFFTAGWGETEYGNRSNVLLWTALPNRTPEFCESTLGIAISEEHICAGGSRFHDTCKGDSGGPLFYQNIYADGVARAIQYGIVSFGAKNCGEMSYPAVYMKISHYLQWITDHIKVYVESS